MIFAVRPVSKILQITPFTNGVVFYVMSVVIDQIIQHCANCHIPGQLLSVDKVICEICKNSDFHQFRLLRSCRYCSSSSITLSPADICHTCFSTSVDNYRNHTRKQPINTESQKQKQHVSKRRKKRENSRTSRRTN